MPPEMWDWKRENDGTREPITTIDSPGPDTVVTSIFCRCKSGCNGKCGSRKASISCSLGFSDCLGSCTNGVVDVTKGEDEDVDVEYR